jgi:hypothetical protein
MSKPEDWKVEVRENGSYPEIAWGWRVLPFIGQILWILDDSERWRWTVYERGNHRDSGFAFTEKGAFRKAAKAIAKQNERKARTARATVVDGNELRERLRR